MTTRPVRSSPSATASRFGEAALVRLADAGEQEDPVVGREAERDREEEHRLRQLERALAAVVQGPSSRPSWNTQTSTPNAAERLSAFITIAFTGRTTDLVTR